MSAPTSTAVELGLPFTMERLARGLETGVRSWRAGERHPLMRPYCDITSLAIKRCLEDRGIPARLAATYEDPSEPQQHSGRFWHVVTIAETTGPVTIDGAYGQFLPQVAEQKGVDIALARRFRQAGMQCLAFSSDAYEEKIHEAMTAIFGDDADEALMARALTTYGELWNPDGFAPYKPDADTEWIAARILPRMQDVLELN